MTYQAPFTYINIARCTLCSSSNEGTKCTFLKSEMDGTFYRWQPYNSVAASMICAVRSTASKANPLRCIAKLKFRLLVRQQIWASKTVVYYCGHNFVVIKLVKNVHSWTIYCFSCTNFQSLCMVCNRLHFTFCVPDCLPNYFILLVAGLRLMASWSLSKCESDLPVSVVSCLLIKFCRTVMKQAVWLLCIQLFVLFILFCIVLVRCFKEHFNG